jgi:hypothetical protein
MTDPAPARSLSSRLLPPGLAATVQRWRADAAVGAAGRALLRANRPLRGRHAGQRGFILCSGPSIKTQDLKPLQGECCLGVSNFFVHPDYAQINPRYHCIAPLHPPFTDADGLRWFREMEAPLAGRELFLGLGERRLVAGHALLPKTTVHYLALAGPWRDPLALDRVLPRPQSVSIMALLVALELGFSEIYLLGTDHTSINFQNGGYAYHHFYSGQRGNALGAQPAPPDLELEFTAYATLWRQYKAVRAAAERRGVQIFNATNGGVLDLFPRVDLPGLFRR